MRFRNCGHSARLLIEKLTAYQGHHPSVLGVPCGTVPMATIIEDARGPGCQAGTQARRATVPPDAPNAT